MSSVFNTSCTEGVFSLKDDDSLFFYLACFNFSLIGVYLFERQYSRVSSKKPRRSCPIGSNIFKNIRALISHYAVVGDDDYVVVGDDD